MSNLCARNPGLSRVSSMQTSSSQDVRRGSEKPGNWLRVAGSPRWALSPVDRRQQLVDRRMVVREDLGAADETGQPASGGYLERASPGGQALPKCHQRER